MNENDAQYNLKQAEIALNNEQYETALELYRKALNDEPENLLALSRAGAVCMILEKYENALRYFNRAIEVDPDNGDNYFNLGNAYFFQDQYSKAFDCYVDAKERGCSDDITARLYYQMALLCSVRGDIKSALIYTGQRKIFCVWKWQKSAKTLRETRKNIRKSAQEKTLCHI